MITTTEKLDYIRHAVENMRGDDLERARAFFSQYSPAEMDKPHLSSGQTRAQVLKGYEDRRELHEAAVEHLKTIL